MGVRVIWTAMDTYGLMSQEQYDLGMSDEEYDAYLCRLETERECMDR